MIHLWIFHKIFINFETWTLYMQKPEAQRLSIYNDSSRGLIEESKWTVDEEVIKVLLTFHIFLKKVLKMKALNLLLFN